MKQSKRWPMLGSALLGLLSNLLVCNALGLSPTAHASVPRRMPGTTYCYTGGPMITDHYDYWQDNLSYPGLGTRGNNMQMHYRLNSDCTLKAYWENITASGGGAPVTSYYFNIALLYNGNNYYWDSAVWGCTTSWGPANFGQYNDGSPANDYVQDKYFANDPNCGSNLVAVNHTLEYQP